MTEKPQVKPIDAAYLPEKLCETGLFCNWRYEWKEKEQRWSKVPYNPKTGRRGDSTNPETFTDLDTALEAEHKHDGVGLGVFGEIAGIDIDHCVNESGELSDLAEDIKKTMNTYCEFSPSGTGLRLLCTVPADFDYDAEKEFYKKNPKNKVEVYVAGKTNRFLTLTGNTLTPEADLEERGNQLKIILDKYMRRTEKQSEKFDTSIHPNEYTDEEIYLNMTAEEKYFFLWAGDTSEYGSPSEADLAFCNALAMWTGRDPERMDQLFRKSGLYRDKWERKDYRENTIKKAIESCKYIYVKDEEPPKNSEEGKEPLFHPESLNDPGPCFVVKSPEAARAVMEAGAPAVALCGLLFGKLLREIEGRKIPLILFLDRDIPDTDGHRPGQEAQANLAVELEAMNVPYREALFDLSKYPGPAKDANDLLTANPEQFKRDIAANLAAAQDPTGIEAFLFEISLQRYKPIPTGIDSIDKLLHGGFIPQSEVLIGGEPGGGKTIFAQQVIESLAKSGRKCIYINLEMSREQLIARSLSRRIYQKNNRYALTALDILQGYKLTETQRELVREAAEEYRRDVGETLSYNPISGADLDRIIKHLNTEGDKAQRAGEPGPCVCLDYLHLLSGKPGEDAKEIIKRAVEALKEYAICYDTVALAIMATSRDANQRKGARLDAGRDTSALEYSGDLILQLKRDKDNDAEGETHLYITKSRFTGTNMQGEKCRIHGGQSYLEIMDEKAIAKQEKFERIRTAFDDL